MSGEILLVVALLGMTLMIIGFTLKKRIFNLLSIGALVTLAIEFSASTGLLIMFIGLIIFNIWFTFWGDM